MADQNYILPSDQEVGLDDNIKRLLKEESEGPKVRHVPGPLDHFKAAGGTVDTEPLKVMHSVPNTGNKPDVDATGSTSSKATPKSEPAKSEHKSDQK